MSVTLSVLICTYNRPQMLAQCLAALIERTDEKPDQVVVVNGGDERTDEAVSRYTGRQGLQVQSVRTTNKNLASSRNVGLPHCRGDIIAMTDDDAEVFPDWVLQMKRIHAECPDAGAVGGPVIGAETDSLVSRIADQVTFPNFPSTRAVCTLPGVNVSYKRQVVEQLGQQDETLFRGEDVDYNWRVLQLGYKVYFDPAIKVYHYHRATLRGFLNQHYMYGRAYYRVRHKWREMYCIYPHGIRSARDFLKAMNFFLGIAYEPLPRAAQLVRWRDRVAAYPLLGLNEVIWRAGMIRQAWLNDEP